MGRVGEDVRKRRGGEHAGAEEADRERRVAVDEVLDEVGVAAAPDLGWDNPLQQAAAAR